MTAELHGRVVDASGAALSDAKVQLCSPLQCKPTEPDADGNFSYIGIEGDFFALEVIPKTEGMSTALGFLTIDMEEVVTLEDPVVVPAFATSETISAIGMVELDGGLSTMAVPSTYSPPLGTPSDDVIVESVRIDPAAVGMPLEGIDGSVVAAWYLGQWNSTTDPRWSISVAGLEGVEEGDTLKIMTADYITVEWVDGGTMTVGADGTATADDGSGIDFLTTLVLVAPAD